MPESEKDAMTNSAENATSEIENPKSHGEIMRQQIAEGEETFHKTPSSLWLSSFSAGLEIGFSYLLICVLYTFLEGKVSEDAIFKLMAFVYPVGFIMIIGGQSILFTEKTSLLMLPVLNKRSSIGNLIKAWAIVIFGNLVGGGLMAAVIVWIGPRLDIIDPSTYEAIANHVTNFDNWTIFVSAILAGWLMGLLSWLLTASQESISRMAVVYLITAVLAFVGLHHSIVGNIEVFAGLISSPKITWIDYLSFQGIALLGNAVGGTVFVAILKYRAFVNNVN
jgi:formate/nitrite transporter FocA (FNT family)